MYELVAQRADKKAPRGVIPTGLARALLKAPGPRAAGARAARLPRGVQPPRALQLPPHAVALLDGDPDVRCPPFDSYVDQLVRYVREVQAQKKQAREEEAVDPLDMI